MLIYTNLLKVLSQFCPMAISQTGGTVHLKNNTGLKLICLAPITRSLQNKTTSKHVSVMGIRIFNILRFKKGKEKGARKKETVLVLTRTSPVQKTN